MKISKAFRDAWNAYTRSIGGTLVFLITEGCLTLICLAPLLFLTKKGMGPGAWLTPVLWIFVMLPARMNAAGGMQNALRGGSLGSRVLVETGNYGAKLICGLKRLGFLLLWGAPLIALLTVGWHHFAGNTDSFTVLRMIKNDLGGGDQMRGLRNLGLTLAGTLVVLMLGCAFHSGARHAFVRGRKEIINGHHGKIFLSWMVSLVCLLPVVTAIWVVAGRYMPVLKDLNGLLLKRVSLPSTRESIMILAAGAVATLPLLPLRSLIPAAYVNGLEEGK